jgi:hypothetical protein
VLTTRFFTAATAALILSGSAAMAHAESKRPAAPTVAFTVKSDFSNNNLVGQYGPQAPKKSLQWDAQKGRWGLKLDLDQPSDRDMQLNDVQAGAYFKVTPSIRVGGAVALGETDPAAAARKNQALQEPAPRVKLETAFKF